jgi:hypothetical protein
MAEPTPTAELKTYKGNCHCGAFKFTVEIPELTSVGECNCSICFRKGYKWVFPGAGCFTIEKGEESLKDYEFGKHSMSHKVREIFHPRFGRADERTCSSAQNAVRASWETDTAWPQVWISGLMQVPLLPPLNPLSQLTWHTV